MSRDLSRDLSQMSYLLTWLCLLFQGLCLLFLWFLLRVLMILHGFPKGLPAVATVLQVLSTRFACFHLVLLVFPSGVPDFLMLFSFFPTCFACFSYGFACFCPMGLPAPHPGLPTFSMGLPDFILVLLDFLMVRHDFLTSGPWGLIFDMSFICVGIFTGLSQSYF